MGANIVTKNRKITTATTTNLTGVITGNGSVIGSKANPTGDIVGTTDTQTLTNKTIDGDLNTVQDLPYSAIKSTSRSGLDTSIITGTANTTNLGLTQWNSDGDLVDSLIKPEAITSGWISAGETWTYASATTITVPSGAASKYQKGDKIKITNNSATKYFYVVGVADTVLTVTGGSDYTVHDSAITNPYFSKIENPQGFPHWFTYTASITGFSANPNMLTRFKLSGTQCTVNFVSTSNGTSNATTYTVSLPITAKTISNYGWRGWILAIDNGTARNGNSLISSGATVIDLYDEPLSAWTNSGNKSANGQISYEI